MAKSNYKGLGTGHDGTLNINTVYEVSYEVIKNGLTRPEAEKIVAERTNRSPQTIQKNHFKDNLHLRNVSEIDEALKTGSVVDLLKDRHPDKIDYIDHLYEGLYN